MSTKIQDNLQNTYEKNNGFLVKNPGFLDEKIGRSSVHSKYQENNCRGTTIFGNNTFFCKFGGPKNRENWRAFRQKNLENNEPFKNTTFFDLGVTL